MNFGFNSNVRVGKDVYHVQTEDRGPVHPFLDTVVYLAGRVVHKRSSSYEDLTVGGLDGEALAQQLRERISLQHRDVVAQMEGGTIALNTDTRKSVAASSPLPQAPLRDSLEVHLLNPKSWLAGGNVTLDVEIRRSGSAEVTGLADVETFLEVEKSRSAPIRAVADEKGRATLSFVLPPAVAEGTTLVIRATDGTLYGELRFRLKAKQQETAPVSK
jgi:hypothetical protein